MTRGERREEAASSHSCRAIIQRSPGAGIRDGEWEHDGPTSDLASNDRDLYSGQQASQMHTALHLAIETDGDTTVTLAL